MRVTARRLASGIAAAALAAAVLTACGGGDDGAKARQPAESSGSAQPGGESGQPDGGTDDADDADDAEEPGTDDATPEPRDDAEGQEEPDEERLGKPVPESELIAPEDREYTEQQQEFLADKVPEGADPAAILEAGEEACHQVGYLARRDADAAVQALREDEIPQAADAVTALCPEHLPLLEQAQKGN
jgi:hypothetical protein